MTPVIPERYNPNTYLPFEIPGFGLIVAILFLMTLGFLTANFVGRKLVSTACGTASYAGIVAKYWFERFARLPTDVDIASEFRYREQPLTARGLSMVISQSGETADTLASLRYARDGGATRSPRSSTWSN